MYQMAYQNAAGWARDILVLHEHLLLLEFVIGVQQKTLTNLVVLEFCVLP